MLDAVTKGFRAAKHKLSGKAELNEANIDDALRDIRVALLEADVEFNVAKRFLARVKEKALGEVVATTATDKKGRKVQASPGDHFIKICHDELENLMGPVDTSLDLARKDLENQPFQALGRRRLRARDRPGLLLDVAEAMLADRLDDRVLGGEEAVDIRRRHLELGSDVGHGGLGEAKPTEQRLRSLDDPSPGIVGPDFGYGGRRVHGRGYCSVAY